MEKNSFDNMVGVIIGCIVFSLYLKNNFIDMEEDIKQILIDLKLKNFIQAKIKLNARVQLGSFNEYDLNIFKSALQLQGILWD